MFVMNETVNPRDGSPRPRKWFAFLSALVLAVSMILIGGTVGGVSSASAATSSQCNGIANAGGEGITCDVTVENTLDVATGIGTSVVTTVSCVGAANTPGVCTTTIMPFNEITTVVDQCNGSGSGGGGTVDCTVTVTNNITGAALTAAGTVNQCNASGTGGGTEPTTLCTPTGSTTNATVTQCNESGNGGGGTLRVQCTVGLNTISDALPITINQCNGSGNGGGATVTCSSSISTIITAAAPPGETPPGETPPGETPPGETPPGETPGETPPVGTPGETPGETPPGGVPVLIPEVTVPPVTDGFITSEMVPESGLGTNAGLNVQTGVGAASVLEPQSGPWISGLSLALLAILGVLSYVGIRMFGKNTH